MSRYTVIAKLSMGHENGTMMQVGSVDNMNEGARLAQQVVFQTGYRGQLWVTILDTHANGACVQNVGTFC